MTGQRWKIICAGLLLSLSACGGGGNDVAPSSVVTRILSDPSFDGDIEESSQSNFVVTQGMSPTVQSVLAGIDPQTASEFRAFLDFSLAGPGGVPGNAGIDSAYLEIFIDDLQSNTGSLPLLVELVSFQPPTLIASDFDRSVQPPLAAVSVNPPISSADVGRFVSIDVTALMVQAQRMGLTDFQVRIMEDLGPAVSSLISIDDVTTSDRAARAPTLTVTYF
ncbi:MAG: hypothetical protein JO210_11255 [Acidobacteriaceae bacterium]|nr:hypothetical protein [Acidobacteriaceae bacterium]